MGEKRAYKPRKPGGGRKKLKPEYDARKNLKEQMESAVALYEEECSLQDIADALVHRFVNNYTNRVGCGFECAGIKTQA